MAPTKTILVNYEPTHTVDYGETDGRYNKWQEEPFHTSIVIGEKEVTNILDGVASLKCYYLGYPDKKALIYYL